MTTTQQVSKALKLASGVRNLSETIPASDIPGLLAYQTITLVCACVAYYGGTEPALARISKGINQAVQEINETP